MADGEPSDAPVVFKKRERSKNMRARPAAAEAPEPADDGDSSSVVRAAKQMKPGPLMSSTAKGGEKKALAAEFAHGSDRRISNYDNKATATNEQDTEAHLDAQAQYERAQAAWADTEGDTAADGSKIYRGQNNYRQYTGKAENFDSRVAAGHGPARAPVHYRATSRFDYQPDICKDYKDTGYCGYGDACKFLHDRSDYKSGWQLEQAWEEEQKKKKHEEALIAAGEMEDPAVAAKKAVGDGLPFACLICREPWHVKSRPVVTKCEHYFCESCALQHAVKTRRCFVCSEQTNGIFNVAKAIQEKIDQRESMQQADVADKEQTEEEILAEYERSKQKTERRGNQSGGWAIV